MLLQTPFARDLDLSHPIVLAPMGAVSGGKLCAAVCNAGGLGLLGVGYGHLDWVERELRVFGEHHAAGAWGAGFITWCLSEELLDRVLERQPDVVMLSFGDPAPWIPRIKASGARVFIQVQTVAAAREAERAGADVIVAQGAEAGGHGGGRATLPLVPAVVDAVAPVPVLAAGGITDGRGLAAALMLGAQGALLGTRLFASHEALGHARVKERLIETGGDCTVRTRVFDIVRGIDWPAAFTGRAVANDFVSRWQGHEAELDRDVAAHRDHFLEAVTRGDVDTAMVWAGEGLDLIDKQQAAAEIVSEIAEKAHQRICDVASASATPALA